MLAINVNLTPQPAGPGVAASRDSQTSRHSAHTQQATVRTPESTDTLNLIRGPL